MNKANIYVITHKAFIPPLKKDYIPIIAGAKQNFLPFKKDNTGDNIAFKNQFYSELTALYWVWKNNKAEIIGFNHYHRYFKIFNHLITSQDIKNILLEHDIIVPKPIYFIQSVFDQYASCHNEKDLELAITEMIKIDKTYNDIASKVLNNNKFYAYNMFISNWNILNDYFTFLFPLLFSLEDKIPYLTYDNYNKRVFGFLAERIFNIYLANQNLNLFECEVEDTNQLRRIK